MISKKSRLTGFTLIELLVVIALIGILSTLLLANFNAARQRSRDAQRKSDLRNIQTALRLYYNDFSIYPTHNTNGQIMGCGSEGAALCGWGEEWSAGGTVYMSSLAKDPISSQIYKYTRVDLDTYTLQACLENKSDDKGQTTSTDWCPSGWMYQVQP